MRAWSRPVATALGAALLILAGACDNPAEPPNFGAIEVLILPSGQDVITQNLQITVANGPVHRVDSGRLQIWIPDLAPGTYEVELEGMSVNCQVTSTNPRQVRVERNQIAVITFVLACTARVGSVRLTTVTTGADLDPDGYVAVIGGVPNQAVPVNGTTTIAGVREGSHTVALNGVATNCTITGAQTAVATVPIGATADVAFSIVCVRFGNLAVTVATSGGGTDPDGYTLDLRSPSLESSATLPVGSNASATFERLRPAPDYTVSIQGLSANCRVAGAAAHTLAVDPGATAQAAFAISCEAPRLLAFVRDDDIHIMGSDGTGLVRLTTTPNVDWEPAWSSTGRIAFTTLRHSGDPELYVMDEDGTNATRLTTSAGGDESPTWSPDGQKIAFQSYRTVNWEIHVINPDGTGLAQLTTNDADDINPTWSSTGKIAFVSTRDHPAGEIYVMNADGSNVVRLTQNDSAEAAPAWSPDGSMIAFTREVECYYGCTHDIFVMNADGTNQRRLATGWQTYSFHSDPAWLTDGQTISFTKQSCGYYYYCDMPAIWAVDIQGAVLQRVTPDGRSAVWKP